MPTLSEAARRVLAVCKNAAGWIAYNKEPTTLKAVAELANAGLIETNGKCEMRAKLQVV